VEICRLFCSQNKESEEVEVAKVTEVSNLPMYDICSGVWAMVDMGMVGHC
jgi:hypothetical protein